MRYFLQNHKNPETEIFVFCVITFEPIKIQTRSAPQNDRQNLNFVKDIYVEGRKLARNGRKTATCQSQILVISLQIITNFGFRIKFMPRLKILNLYNGKEDAKEIQNLREHLPHLKINGYLN